MGGTLGCQFVGRRTKPEKSLRSSSPSCPVNTAHSLEIFSFDGHCIPNDGLPGKERRTSTSCIPYPSSPIQARTNFLWLDAQIVAAIPMIAGRLTAGKSRIITDDEQIPTATSHK